jgi:hypothetical protein
MLETATFITEFQINTWGKKAITRITFEVRRNFEEPKKLGKNQSRKVIQPVLGLLIKTKVDDPGSRFSSRGLQTPCRTIKH